MLNFNFYEHIISRQGGGEQRTRNYEQNLWNTAFSLGSAVKKKIRKAAANYVTE